MKILVICQNYAPEPFRVADICEALVQKGHTVDVVTSFPNYPHGDIYKGYKNSLHKKELLNGVTVNRVFTFPRKKGVIGRIINYCTYPVSSSLFLMNRKEKYDVIFVYQLSPVLMGTAAVKYKKKHGTKMVLYSLDLWPDSLLFSGIKKGGIIYRYFKNISERIYASADKLLVSSRSFTEYFEKTFGGRVQTPEYLPQYAEDVFVPEKIAENEIINITFAGNIGKTQSVETIIRAAKLLEEEKVIFNIYGDGSGFEDTVSLKEKLKADNVIFHGRKPLAEMPSVYAQSDGLIVTLSDNDVLSKSFPGKIQSYMAAGKPVIASANGETEKIIEEARCGFCSPAEDEKALAESIKKFLLSNKEELGKNAREYYENNFLKECFITSLIKELSN